MSEAFWYFRFEGRLREENPEHNCTGISSDCLVPSANHEIAQTAFLGALDKKGIDLVSVLEEFALNIDELDKDDESNDFWFELYEHAKKCDAVTFCETYLFEADGIGENR